MDHTEKDPKAKVQDAMIPQRSLLTYTLAATIPIIAVLLFTQTPDPTVLIWLTVIAAITYTAAFGRLLYELVFDIAGYPEYKLPVWSVAYLIVYIIGAFAFTIFGLEVAAPGRFFGGIATGRNEALVDSLYLSVCNYVGVPSDPVFTAKVQSTRLLSVSQGFLSMLLNVVIITKFVSAF
jgi:hypothetical protein